MKGCKCTPIYWSATRGRTSYSYIFVGQCLNTKVTHKIVILVNLPKHAQIHVGNQLDMAHSIFSKILLDKKTQVRS